MRRLSKSALVTLALLCGGMVGALLIAFMVHRLSVYHTNDFVKILDASNAKTYTDLEGTSVSLTSYMGKPFFLVSWASWCPSCGEALQVLSRIAPESSLPVVAINRKEARELAKDYLQFIQKPKNITYVMDTTDSTFSAMNGYTMPELVLYDAEGMEVTHTHGTFTEEEVRAALVQLHVQER